jgi:hypothetical protein
LAVAEVNGKIYVVGGFGGERELEIYDPSTDRWSRGTAIPRALHHAGAPAAKYKNERRGCFIIFEPPRLKRSWRLNSQILRNAETAQRCQSQ